MSFAMERFKRLKRVSDPIYKTPKSVQQLIPIYRVAENGIFELENEEGADHLWDKAYIFLDINYATRDEDQKEEIFEIYCKILNMMNLSYKIVIANEKRNIEKALEEMLIPSSGNPLYTSYIQEMNRVLERGIRNGNGIEKMRYLILSCEAIDYEHARGYFATIEEQLSQLFNRLGSGLIPINCGERLRSLHAFYRLGKENEFNWNWADAVYMRRNWKNDICNTAIKEHKDYLEFDNDRVVRVLFAKTFPNSMPDDFLTELTSVSFHTITALDVIPVPKDVSYNVLMDIYMNVEQSIIKQQEIRNRQNQFSTDITYDRRREKEELEESLDDVRNNDERLSHVGLTVMVTAENLEELNARCETIINIGSSKNVIFEPHIWNQLAAMQTTLPIAGRRVLTMRPLFIQPLAALMPFNCVILLDKGGIFYGCHQMTKEVLYGNRKRLLNGNGWVFGMSGGGKSAAEKMEMMQILFNTEDCIIVIDPTEEYRAMGKKLGGQAIEFSAGTQNYLNPFEVRHPDELEDIGAFIREKCQFAINLCGIVIAPDILTAQQRSLVDKAISQMYHSYFERYRAGENPESPTLVDLQEILAQFDRDDAYELVDGLEIFANGSLNIFSHQSNVDTSNRFLVYSIKDMTDELKKLSMSIMMENIATTIADNAKHGLATWVYVEEAHLLISDEYVSILLERFWKTVRKLGGMLTAITQNIMDVLINKRTKTMLANSEYILMLNQERMERLAFLDVLDISDRELEFITRAEPGTGLLKFGNKLLPTDLRIPKDDGELYALLNTNLHEKIEKQRFLYQQSDLEADIKAAQKVMDTDGQM